MKIKILCIILMAAAMTAFCLPGAVSGAMENRTATPSVPDRATPSEGTPDISLADGLPEAETREPVVLYSIEEDIFYTTVSPGMSYEELPKPEDIAYFPDQGDQDWTMVRFCSLDWGEEAYIRGMESGTAAFTLTGTPGLEFLEEEDKLLWNQGLLYVDKASWPKLVVRVIPRHEISFKVELAEVNEDEYMVWFTFPVPHGASSVILEASIDGETWYTQEEWPGNEFILTDVKVYMLVREENDEPVLRPSSRKTYYFKMKVEGSAYDGETKILKVEPDAPDKGNDDIDGNRGGVSGGGGSRFPQGNPDSALTGPGVAEKNMQGETAVEPIISEDVKAATGTEAAAVGGPSSGADVAADSGKGTSAEVSTASGETAPNSAVKESKSDNSGEEAADTDGGNRDAMSKIGQGTENTDESVKERKSAMLPGFAVAAGMAVFVLAAGSLWFGSRKRQKKDRN